MTTSESRTVAPRLVRRLLIAASVTGALAVALMAFAMSFDALAALARGAGIRGAIAWMWPIVVDGSMIVATAAALVLRNSPERAVRTYPWAQLALFALVSVIGNGLHATAHAHSDLQLPAVVAVAVSGVPPVALLLSTHLLVMMLPRWRWTADEPSAKPGAADEPIVAHPRPRAARGDEPAQLTGSRLGLTSEPVSRPAAQAQPTRDPAGQRATGREPVSREAGQREPQPAPARGPEAPETAPVAEPSAEPVVPAGSAPDHATPAQGASSASDEVEALALWIATREDEGEAVSGQLVADHLGVSLSTGKRRLRAARERLEEAA